MGDQLILISGSTTTGKSFSLRTLKNPKGVMYLGTEAGKRLPFKSKFTEYKVVDPLQVHEAFDKAESMPEIHTIVVDSLTFLMDQYESIYVLTAQNGMKAWGEFQQYFKKLMQIYVASSTKDVIFTAHTQSILNEADMLIETKVPVKGALKANGIESYFSTVISTKCLPLKDLEKYSSDKLIITDDEKDLGFKYVFQTQLTKETINERIRSPHMFSKQETFIDNDIQIVMGTMKSFYGD